MSEAKLTGRKVFAMFAVGFGIIITVNLTLAFNAVRTFPGLETKNSYVASQRFDEDRAAQDALGWSVDAALDGGKLTVAIRDAAGAAVYPEVAGALFGRPTHVGEDREPALVWTGAAYEADVDPAPGQWILKLDLVAKDGTQFRRTIPLWVRGA
ncbi:FixH family protein [Aestuariibius sp. 2305UL40-4]|uniref:FixH family protein n=1 Tax=Aestuariibius violaceus TaxID=3234132 RepID=UPI00345ED4AC